MGEVVMKMFDKANFVCSGLEGKQKKQGTVLLICLAVLYVLSAFTFMNFLYCLSDCIGSIVCSSADIALRDALRSVPIFLSFFVTLGGLMVCQSLYRNEGNGRCMKLVKKHAWITIVIGAIIILYTIIMRIAGRYISLVEGAPSPIYPLDAMLYALLFILLGVAVIVYTKKYAADHPFEGVTRLLAIKKVRVFHDIFMTLWLLISLYGFCGFFYSLFIVDFKHGYLPYTLATMFASLVAFCSFAVWELYYNNLKPEKKKEQLFKVALISLCVSVLSAVLYFVALKFNLDGPSNVGFGILPIAFSASVNIATFIVVFTPLIASIAGLVKGLIIKKRG